MNINDLREKQTGGSVVVPKNVPESKMIMQAVDDTFKLPDGVRIAYIQQNMDCITEKVIIEYAEIMSREKLYTFITPEEQFKDAMNYAPEIVVLVRCGMNAEHSPVKEMGEWVVYLRKAVGVRVVYYADDFIFGQNNGAPLYLASRCDATIVATTTLRDYLKSQQGWTNPIYLVPTHMEIATKFDPIKPYPFTNNNKRILLFSTGRIGANGLIYLCDHMDKNPDRYKDVELLIVAQNVAELRSVVNRFRNVKKRYWDWQQRADLYAIVKSCDIIIAPAETADLAYLVPDAAQGPWLDAKSEVKYCIAGAARKPLIVSPLKQYVSAVKDGETAYIMHDYDEMIKYVDDLLVDEDLRTKLGEAARKDVEARYKIEDRYPMYKAALTGSVSPDAFTTEKLVWMVQCDGGPGAFVGTLAATLPEVSKRKWGVTHVATDAGPAALLLIAYLGIDYTQHLKKNGSATKHIMRVDGVPFMSYLGDPRLPELKPGDVHTLHMRMMQEAFKLADIVIWQSQFCKDVWTSHLKSWGMEKILEENQTIIHNSVDPNFTFDGEKYPLPAGINPIKVLHVNWSIFPHKRIDLLIKVIKENPDITFTLLGQHYSMDVGQEVIFWSDFPNVNYMGPIRTTALDGSQLVPEQANLAKGMVASVYRGADVLLFTSEMEGSPNVVFEAIGCGLPIIYNSNVNIVHEICGDLAVPFHEDVHQGSFRDALESRNFTDLSYRKSMAELKEKYSAEIMAKKYAEVLDKLCG